MIGTLIRCWFIRPLLKFGFDDVLLSYLILLFTDTMHFKSGTVDVKMQYDGKVGRWYTTCYDRNDSMYWYGYSHLNGTRYGEWVSYSKGHSGIKFINYQGNKISASLYHNNTCELAPDISSQYIEIYHKNGTSYECTTTYNATLRKNIKNGYAICRYSDRSDIVASAFITEFVNDVLCGDSIIIIKCGDAMQCRFNNGLACGTWIKYYVGGGYVELTINSKVCKVELDCGDRYVTECMNSVFAKNGTFIFNLQYADVMNALNNTMGVYYSVKDNLSYLYRCNMMGMVERDVWVSGCDMTKHVFGDVKVCGIGDSDDSCDSDMFCDISSQYVFMPIILGCGHKFCKIFIEKWKRYCDKNKSAVTCPLCRATIEDGAIIRDEQLYRKLQDTAFLWDGVKVAHADICAYYKCKMRYESDG